MSFELQPTLKNQLIELVPLKNTDFEKLYMAASDPLIWEQHPMKDRHKREVFEVYFKEAIESGGAFLFIDAVSREVIGSSRYYYLDEAKSTVSIGYTFMTRRYWGKGYNESIKSLMLNHAFRFVDHVYFHVGAYNIRSQIAIQRLGAVKVVEKDEKFTYLLEKRCWNGLT
jgi:RimJ/RimL family protein N-acetyltransferase